MKTIFSLCIMLCVGAAFAQSDSCCTKTCDSTVAKKFKGDDEFMRLAAEMTQESEGKEENCCRSTEAKVIAKGSKGCCNEKGIAAKYKVMVAGKYQYFGCKDSAVKGRKLAMAAGKKVGKVQAVSSKQTKIS